MLLFSSRKNISSLSQGEIVSIQVICQLFSNFDNNFDKYFQWLMPRHLLLPGFGVVIDKTRKWDVYPVMLKFVLVCFSWQNWCVTFEFKTKRMKNIKKELKALRQKFHLNYF